MIAVTEQLAGDGRPLIEVRSITRELEQVTIEGTAVAYEGTVLLEISDGAGNLLASTFTTASAGGPSRGEWDARVHLPSGATRILVQQEEMEEGAATAHSRQVILSV